MQGQSKELLQCSNVSVCPFNCVKATVRTLKGKTNQTQFVDQIKKNMSVKEQKSHSYSALISMHKQMRQLPYIIQGK